MPDSAWAQWGSRPNQGAIKEIQGSLSSLLRNSTGSSSSVSTHDSSASSTPNSAITSIQSFWSSVQGLAADAVQLNNEDNEDAENPLVTMENGRMEPDVRDMKRKSSFWSQSNRNVNEVRSNWLPTLSWNVRLKWFVVLLFMSAVFFSMALLFVPLIMLRPSKFALSFTFGSVCCMGSVAILKGPMVYVNSLLQLHTLLLTTVYWITLGSTLYSCLILGNYMLVLISSFLQMLTLAISLCAALPKGKASMKAFIRLVRAAFWKLLQLFKRLLS
uniref:Vesicle transport protein n=1 Tax=Albugo laibachii Nc14 TaxID=890382 RepID=F0W1S3_9STRA|nr:conserved hypothetical protein [Albugo laibachii Nc14]CCA25493.1 conserved hypothetical protein [Albugo laibachii Nc14]|eukprot:CCA25493.1 conserved hypothetical protein [Albugo laibachii Nc14]